MKHAETPPDRTETERLYISILHEDIRVRINDGKKRIADLVKWVVAVQSAIIGFFFSSFTTGLPWYVFLLPLAVGVAGVVLCIAILGDMNWQRQRIAQVRKFMGGFVVNFAGPGEVGSRGKYQKIYEVSQLTIIMLVSVIAAFVVYEGKPHAC